MNRDAEDEIREIKEDVKELAKKQEDNFRELRERQEADGAAFRAWMAHADAVFAGLNCGEHNAFINGNGHPGAKQRLAVIERSVAELENHDIGAVEARVSELDGFRRDAKRLFIAIVGFICLQVGLAAWNHLVAPTERPAPAAVERLQR